MKTLPALLDTHIASGTTTLADLLKITRKDGAVYAFTSADDDVTIGGVTYIASQGLDISSLEVSAGLAVDNLELTTLDDGTVFTRAQVLSGVWRNAAFEISRYNWATPANGVEVRMVGTVGEVHLRRGTVVAELRGLQQYLQQPIGSVTSKTCRARLGDALCRVNLAGYTATGEVSSVISNQSFGVVAEGETPGDAYFGSVVLSLHGNGANNSTVFTDSSSTPNTITANGNARISTAQSKFGGASMYFDGSGDYLDAGSSSALAMGTSDFTIEFWVRFDAVSQTRRLVASTLGAFDAQAVVIRLSAANRIYAYCGGAAGVTGSIPITTGVWYHIAMTRASGLMRIFVNGVLDGSESSPNNMTNGVRYVGGYYTVGTTEFHNGYIDDLRITKGVARYTANFTPPTAAFIDAVGTGGIFAADYFAEGILTFTSGPNIGLSAKVKSFTGDAFVLALPMIQAVEVGDTYTAVAGCRKRLSDCSSKFNNAINFQGEPHLPGIDAVTS